jgi:nicotinamide-nucleotide amidase
MSTQDLNALTHRVGQLLIAQRLTLAVAESCTGGGIAETITSIAGSSQYFDRGFVTYSNLAKGEMLGVNPTTLEKYGAVSEHVAREMAEGALHNSSADITVAVTGIAGPDGGTPDKPVGTVWFAWARKGMATEVQHVNLVGDRTEIRRQAVEIAIGGVVKILI